MLSVLREVGANMAPSGVIQKGAPAFALARVWMALRWRLLAGARPGEAGHTRLGMGLLEWHRRRTRGQHACR